MVGFREFSLSSSSPAGAARAFCPAASASAFACPRSRTKLNSRTYSGMVSSCARVFSGLPSASYAAAMVSSSHTALRLFLSILRFCAKHACTKAKNWRSVPLSGRYSAGRRGRNPTRHDSTFGGGSKHAAVTGRM